MRANGNVTVDPPRAQTCGHCGEATPDPVSTDDGAFCCAGCAAVFAIIRTHGLEAFYACDLPAGVSQRRARHSADDYADLDRPEAAELYGATERQGVVAVEFAVPALHCASCVWLIEQLWRFEPGVLRAEVDMLRRTVRVEFRVAESSLRRVAERLAALGYPPTLEGERRAGNGPADRRSLYLRIGVAGFAFGNVMLFSIPRYANGVPLDAWLQHFFNGLNLLLALPVLLYSASPYFRAAWYAARTRALTLDVPVALGLAVLFARSVVDIVTGRGEGFLDSFSGLVFFLLVGRLFQQKAYDGIAFDRTVRSFLPLSVRVDRDGVVSRTAIDQLACGDVILLRHQEIVPADATLLDQPGRIDYAFATGESTPTTITAGATVAAGGRVVSQALRLRVIRPMSQSRLLAIWNAPELRRTETSSLANLSLRFGAWFTVAAVGLAAGGAVWWWPDTVMATSVATAVLIIACPCALTLAAPITLGTAMGVLGRAGFYVKHPGIVLNLCRIDTVVFDKTGTLTTPGVIVDRAGSMLTAGTRRLVSRLAAESVHPVSRAVASAVGSRADVSDVREVPGRGLSGRVNQHHVVMGSAAMIGDHTRTTVRNEPGRTWVAVDGSLAGWFDVVDHVRPGVIDAVSALSRRYNVRMLSGDHPTAETRWTSLFGGRAQFGLAPHDKLIAITNEQKTGRRLLMIGDGLNDAAALRAADVGLAVSDDTACIVPACDAVIRGDQVPVLPAFLEYARRARRVILICLLVSLFYNAIGLSLALTGALTPLATAILMPISSLTIVGLSVGLMRHRAPRPVTT